MNEKEPTNRRPWELDMHATASPAAHVKRSGGFYLSAAALIWLNAQNPNAGWWILATACLWAGALWDIRLAGFTIARESDQFQYRNGFYRWRKCHMSEIKTIRIEMKKTKWGNFRKDHMLVEVENQPDWIIPFRVFPPHAIKWLNRLPQQTNQK